MPYGPCFDLFFFRAFTAQGRFVPINSERSWHEHDMGILKFLGVGKGPQKIEAAVVSASAVNLDRLVEVYGPEEILPDYTECLNAISGEIKKAGGRVAVVSGAGAVFFFPGDAKGRYAEDACRAAFAIRRRFDELNTENGRLGIVELRSIVGVNVGEIEVEKDRAAGTAIDVAAQVMSACDPMSEEVVVSQSVFRLLDMDKAYLKIKDAGGPLSPSLPTVYSLLHMSD